MAQNPFRALKQILSERRELAQREQQLLRQMISALPATGNVAHLGKTASRRKSLTCQRCDRRFALPMHLGRHVAMTHKRRRAA